MRLGRILLGGVAALLVGGAGAYALTLRTAIDPIPRPDPASFDQALVEKGASLAAVGNCIACHTVPGGEAFAGGLPLPTPFGTIYSTNITPDEETGIGTWSKRAFARSLRQGVDRDGHHLYPAFPYDQYTLTSDEDVEALYAYLMTRTPVRSTPLANELPFPLNIRASVAGWKLLFLDDGRFEPDPNQSEAWNRGAYLAEGLGHCGGCHTPRNALGARIEDQHWAGGEAEGWWSYAINEASPAPVPWDAGALTYYLRHGYHEAHGVSRGPMAEVTGNLARLPDEDIGAIALYTTSQMGGTPEERSAAAEQALGEIEARGTGQASDTQTQPAAAAEDASRGGALFAAACASCHESGRPQPYGGLDFHLSTAVHSPEPRNIVVVTLYGLPPADGMASAVMPGFDGVLSDGDVVEILNYMRTTYTDEPAWDGLGELVAQIRSGQDPVSVRPADMIERAPVNLGAEEGP